MNRRQRIILLGVLTGCAALAISCSKQSYDFSDGPVELSFDVEDVELPYEDAGKVTDNVSGSTHVFHWEAGDRIRLFAYKTPTTTGEKHISDLGVFTATHSGKTTTFRGQVSSIDRQANKLFAVYEANDKLTYHDYSETYNNTYFYKIFMPIEDEQTGDGIRHAIFASNTGELNLATMTVTSPLSFKMSTPVMSFDLQPDKDIASITISCDGAYFVGDQIQMRTSMMGLNSGWNKAVITLRNGAVLAKAGETTRLSFASSQLTKAGKTIHFDMVATDGSACRKSIVTPAATVAHHIYYLGKLTPGTWLSEDTPAEGETAAQAVKNMGMGTNLCCTFECGLDYEEKGATREDPISFETMTARSKTTQQTMNSLAAAGFSTIRIPVTWYPHMDNTLATIDKVWLDRIGEVVQYALNAGMYAIINVHADAGNNANTWLLADMERYNDISARFLNIWGQIAQYFRDYDYRLIFEAYNEIVDYERTWFWPKKYSSVQAANLLNQAFVNTVRATGGYNTYRNLCVNTFSAGTLDITLKNFVMPSDRVDGHLMVQVHSYKPANFCSADLSRATYDFGSEEDIAEVAQEFSRIKQYLLDKGYPVVLGEFGSFPTKDRPDKARGHHAAEYLRRSLALGIAPMYWYNPMDYHQRSAGTWTYPELKDSLVMAYKKIVDAR